jgi:sec-independent protein translocase protein TatA
VHFGTPADIFGVDGIIILVVVVVVLFGGSQIPKLARSLGSAQKEFKKGIEEGSSEDGTSEAKAVPPVVATPPAPLQAPPTVEVNVDGQQRSSS